MQKELSMVSLFETFIKETANGKRVKLNGQKIKKQSVENYRCVLKLLNDFESHTGKSLRVVSGIRNDQRLIRKEKRYWTKFYRDFSLFLFRQKGCYDNYCGHVFKVIKCFFRYLKNEKFIALQEFYESFYVRKEDIRIISLLPERFCFLVMDRTFSENLSISLRRCKDLFIFGCTAALRFSDLMNIRVRDIEKRGPDHFLDFRSVKTDTPVKVKLPEFAIRIFLKYSRYKSDSSHLFPSISLPRFNANIRKIGRLAGWTEPMGKFRSVNGNIIEQRRDIKSTYRFCDLLSSHVMRRTGISLLLMMGMPEIIVRKISGHAAHSRSFFRYVNFAQSYITNEIDKVHEKIMAIYQDTLQVDPTIAGKS